MSNRTKYLIKRTKRLKRKRNEQIKNIIIKNQELNDKEKKLKEFEYEQEFTDKKLKGLAYKILKNDNVICLECNSENLIPLKLNNRTDKIFIDVLCGQCGSHFSHVFDVPEGVPHDSVIQDNTESLRNF